MENEVLSLNAGDTMKSDTGEVLAPWANILENNNNNNRDKEEGRKE